MTENNETIQNLKLENERLEFEKKILNLAVVNLLHTYSNDTMQVWAFQGICQSCSKEKSDMIKKDDIVNIYKKFKQKCNIAFYKK